MLVKTPPMGWNTWNTFGSDIQDGLVREIADSIVSDGYLAAGYDTIVIDDGWQEDERSSDGHLVVDKAKFPYGIKALADYIHNKGLKFGIYSAAGVRTCCNKPGSFGYEFIDAQDFADWGVDYLKYDLCHFPGNGDCNSSYLTMSIALKSTGRNIVYSGAICGENDPGSWMRSIGAHQYRISGDICDAFGSMKFIAEKRMNMMDFTAIGCYADMDMLTIGMDGKGHTANGGCSLNEYYMQFALWCFYASPLFIGCDIRNVSDAVKKILCNKTLISINQDEECNTPYRERKSRYARLDENRFTLMKQLSDNKFAFGFFNFGEETAIKTAYMNDFGLPAYSNKNFIFTDIENNVQTVVKDACSVNLEPHSCKVFIGEIVNGR